LVYFGARPLVYFFLYKWLIEEAMVYFRFCFSGRVPLFAMSTIAVAAQVEQNQRAYQKQDCIFVGKKRVLGKKASKRESRYYKAVGLGIKTPRTAIEGTYVDKKCPWTGSVNIRGKLITGVIKTTKMKNTIIIRKDYLHYIKKYNRFEKRHHNTPVHCSPAFRVKPGDEILAGQCRCRTLPAQRSAQACASRELHGSLRRAAACRVRSLCMPRANPSGGIDAARPATCCHGTPVASVGEHPWRFCYVRAFSRLSHRASPAGPSRRPSASTCSRSFAPRRAVTRRASPVCKRSTD